MKKPKGRHEPLPDVYFLALFNLCLLIICQTKKKMFWHWNKNGWMWPCQAKERKTTHQLWHENCSLLVCIIVVNDKHSFFIWAKWKHVKVVFFLPSLWLCYFFFIIRLFYSFECVWLFCIYSMYMLRLMCMWRRIFCIWHSSACTVHIFIFPTCSSLKIKRNRNLKLYVICSEWAAACKHWYGPLIFSHPHGRQMTERKWGRQNNITIIIIVIL